MFRELRLSGHQWCLEDGIRVTEVREVIALDIILAASVLTTQGPEHATSLNTYEGCSVRLRDLEYQPCTSVFDECCGGAGHKAVRDDHHLLSGTLSLDSPPRGDAFHMLNRFDTI